MGERTQLLINVKDKEDNLIIGTVLHYQWGYGRVMPMDALTLITNFPQRFILRDNFDNYDSDYPAIDSYLKDLGLESPMVARHLYSWLGKTTNSGVNNIDIDFKKIEQNLNNYKNMYTLSRAFKATPQNFYKQCDNNDGFMIADIIFDEYITSCEFKFCLNPEEILTLEDYAKTSTHKRYLTSSFVKAYKTICNSFDIKIE
ncbi:hypothetical protein [Lactobacillus taiwanensis]|uniref:hypothetical protein n=1 Tax=Lactobacillus taiwanensis TaxID=508451 RepID=UPI00272D30C8|nr:hypothetical protein [Lactobacillus taiwanensis]